MANTEMLELIRDLRDPGSSLSEEERAAAEQRVHELHAQMRRENEAVERPYEELSARHPDWVDF